MRLVADDIVVRYPRMSRDVLMGASLTVDEGETLAILGPSGSGKSTLLSVLGGLIRPSSGAARVEGYGARRAPTLRQVSAWVLQTVNVLPERTALDNVAVAGLTRGLSHPEARRQAADRLAAVGLSGRAQDQVRVLSGGEVQRVVIARALNTGLPFVLADEPTGQLDRATSDTVLDALFTTALGAAVIIVTHDPAVAARCGRVVRIEDGAVVHA